MTALTYQSVRPGYLGYVMFIGLETYIVKAESTLENVTRLIIENCSLVDNSYQHVW